jgi:ParB family chromosome partitioning protein
VNARRGLGRGLDALLPGPPPGAAPAPSVALSETAAGVRELAVDEISPNPQQPRRVFVEADLEALAASIQRHGVLQPVVVREAPPGATRRYELVVGERRWRAAQRAGLTRLPVTIQNVAPRELLELALVENVQRRDLNPIELALAFRALTENGATQDEVGARVGLERSTVANHLRLLDLAKDAQEDVESGRLSVGHAKALLAVAHPERRRLLHERIVAGQLSVRAAEELARQLGGASAPRRPGRTDGGRALDPNLRGLVDQLEAHLQTRVRIQTEGARGRIELAFASPEELARLTALILDGRRL